jgi:protein TonB
MKGLENVGGQPPLLMDLSQSDSGGLFKTWAFSLLLHIILIIFLILTLKTGIKKSGSSVYRVTIQPLSPQTISNPYPLQALPPPQPVLSKTQIEKEEEKKPKEEIPQKEPIKEPKQLPQHQAEEQTIKKPIPLPMASTPTPNIDSNLEKEHNLPISLALPPEGTNKNTFSELSAEEETGTGTGKGTGIGGSASSSSVEGQGTGQEGSRRGGPGVGPGRGSSGWGVSGKEPGTGSGIPGLRGSGKGTGTGTGSGTGSGTGTGTGTGKGGQRGGSGVGRSGVSSPGYAENPKPFYPPEARQKGYEGEVLLKVEVLSNGRVGEVELKKSSGHEILDQSALDTIKKWRFIPAKKGGVAIPSWVTIPFKFQLREPSF